MRCGELAGGRRFGGLRRGDGLAGGSISYPILGGKRPLFTARIKAFRPPLSTLRP